MEQNKKWYPVYHDEVWSIYADDGIDQLWTVDVGEEQAAKNAILVSSAPELLQALQEMYNWIELHCKYTVSKDNSRPRELLTKYEQLINKLQ